MRVACGTKRLTRRSLGGMLLPVALILASRSCAVPRMFAATGRQTLEPAAAQVSRSVLWRLAGLPALVSALPPAALAEYDISAFSLFKTDLYTAGGERVKASFGTPWPVERRDAGFRAAFNPRRSNTYPGEVAYLEVVPRIGVGSVEELTGKQLIDAIFYRKEGQLGESGTPVNPRQVGKATLVDGAGGLKYRTIGGRYTKVGSNGLEVDAHWLGSAAVIGGDLFAFIATCRESDWKTSQKRVIPSVESFQVVATSR